MQRIKNAVADVVRCFSDEWRKFTWTWERLEGHHGIHR